MIYCIIFLFFLVVFCVRIKIIAKVPNKATIPAVLLISSSIILPKDLAFLRTEANKIIISCTAPAKIERYMAIPGQALSYKVGQMAILAEKKYYAGKLGSRFNLASFHDEVLGDGCVPLNILHEKLAAWGTTQAQ